MSVRLIYGNNKLGLFFFSTTSLARGTRPWTEVSTDHARVDIFNTKVSDAPAVKYQEASQLITLFKRNNEATIKFVSPRKVPLM